MKIGVISDIHENFHNLLLALNKLKTEGVEQILCLGDLMNAGIAKVLSIQPMPVYLIWGNNDGEKVDIVRTAFRKNSNLKVSLNVYDFLEFDKRKIFISHYDDLALPMATSGLYDAVFFGHNHIKSFEKIGNCIVANPGEIAASKTGKATLLIYETTDNTVQFFELDNIKTLKSDLVDAYFKENKEQMGFRSKESFDAFFKE
ncbi:MAG: YfcE family phosphodiesterase [Saprospiraceae bacterium]|nr:YfcE family phosphodiesterase [Saprospiraceae bacterium]